jgi:hypothetical protein
MENLNEVKCPICNSIVKWDDTYDYEIQESQGKLVLYKTGTCERCKETVDYNITYNLENKKTEIVNHYYYHLRED